MEDSYHALYENNELKAIFYTSNGGIWWMNTSPSTLELKAITQEDFEKLEREILDMRAVREMLAEKEKAIKASSQ